MSPSLGDGIELIGACQGSGRRETPSLVRRPDGRMVELSPLLYLVAASLDPRRELRDIASIASTDLGRRVSADNVAHLIDHKLRPLGLVEGSGATAAAPPTGLLGLQLRTGVVRPALVRGATGALRPLFRPAVVVAALAALVGADAWMLLGHGIGRGLSEVLYRPSLLLLVAGLTVLAAAFHELGHATACRYGGAEPGAIGVGVYLLWPVFYNDLNDSYRLDRRGRLRADLGGVYFNAIFILGLVGAFRVTGAEVLLLVAVMQHVMILQQLLPFIRLDGYYIASDLAGVPDLFGNIGPILSSLVPGRPVDARVAELRPRARWVATVWVALTVPLLAAALVLLTRSAPHLVGVSWRASAAQARVLLDAVQSADLVLGLLSGLQLIIVAVPFIGLSVPVLRWAHRRWADRPASSAHAAASVEVAA
jgi:putative peptide zinc metalloprotease protein